MDRSLQLPHFSDGKCSGATYSLAWKPPFHADGLYRDLRPHGQSIAEIVASVPGLPAGFATRGVVCVNGEPVARAFWPYVRPKAGSEFMPVAVTLHLPLAGGRGVKNVLALVAAVALIAVTNGIASGALLAGITGGAGLGASLLAGAVGIVGALTISALTAPPTKSPTAETAAETEKTDASISGNVLRAGGDIPRVVGTHKIFPPFATEPLVTLDGDDEYVEAVVALAGPHQLASIRINEAPISEQQNIEFETREGWPHDQPITLVTRQARTLAPNIELSLIDVDPGDDQANTLTDQIIPDRNLPVWHSVLTRDTPDEIHTHLFFNEGIYDLSSPNSVVFIPLRLRFRLAGAATWTNGPEFHVAGKLATRHKMDVALLWQPAPQPTAKPPSSKGTIRAFTIVPGQTIAPQQSGWQADAWFGGTVAKFLDASNFGTSDVAHIGLASSSLILYLDEANFPKGRYEIQFMLGAAVLEANFAKSSYQTSGQVRNLFGYWSDGGIARPAQSQDKGRRASIQRVQSIWNEHPIAREGLALIALRAKNQSINSLSTIASGYVRDWNGTGWNQWTTTSNPAAHYRDVLSGALNLDPLPDDLRDDQGLLDWRTENAARGYLCDTIFEGTSTDDVLSILASCGYARPYKSEIWGVTMDRDRAGEAPVQVFSRRNMANFRWQKAFARVPNAFRVTFRDADLDYEDREFFAYRPGTTPGADLRIEDVRHEGLVNEVRSRVRAEFDLQQAIDRSTFYVFDAPAEHVVVRKGDLVGLQHDILLTHAGDGRIAGLTVAGGFITHLDLDSEIEVLGAADMLALSDMLQVGDLLEAGLQTGIVIRRTDGTFSVHELANPPGSWSRLELADPIAVATVPIMTASGLKDFDLIEEGALVVAGELGAEYLRCLVQDVEMGPDLTATLTLVDEAPALVRVP